GALEEIQSVTLPGKSGPMGLSPDGRLLYVNTSSENGAALATFSVNPDGTLEKLHAADCGWNSGYVRVDAKGRFITGNSYGAGKVGIWPLDENGVYRGGLVRDFELEKKAHSAVFSPDNHYLFVPATGPNKIFQLVFKEETGAIHPNQPSSAPVATDLTDVCQPRHLIFHPNERFAYTSNEKLRPGVGVWEYDKEAGRLTNIQGIASVDGDSDGMSTADIHFSKNHQFVFVSNRDGKNKNAPQGRDAITVFKIDDTTGRLSLVNRFPCERIPRSFAVGREGKLLFVSGQGDSKLGVYQIDQDTGILTKVESHQLPGKPVWVSVLPFGKG
ncbi:MAG: beta-propeller fold lactonase family protein, partial [Verrucomicrobiales bacterium]|nr:beta-propeller fold lactonase family protein [Verrucomicrobiales bacterium]